LSISSIDEDRTANLAATGRSVDAVVAAIRGQIRRQKLLPGEQVRQNDWAERVGVSRVPVREALNSLARAGVLTHDPNRGFFLTKYSQSEIAQLYFARGVLEVQIARSIRWPSSKEIRALSVIGDRMSEAANTGDAGVWLDEHDRFHSVVLSLSPLKVLVEEADRLWIRTESFRAMRVHSALRESLAEALSHTDVIDALKNQDRDRLVNQFSREAQVNESSFSEWSNRQTL
jgi:DNA-binding GntR family transcriptional regulator